MDYSWNYANFNYEKHFEKGSEDKNFLLNFHCSLLDLDNYL